MFATSNYPDVMSDPGRKRFRDSDADATTSASLGEHRNKRIHSLPLRRSPRSTGQHDDPWTQDLPQTAELDMMDSMDSSFHDDNDGGVVAFPNQPAAQMPSPTPLQPPFASQVRGQQCEWAGPGPALSNLNGVVNMGHHSSGFARDDHHHHGGRRLAPPITEDDISADQCIGSLDMMLDDSSAIAVLPRDAPALLATPQRAMHHPNAMMVDVESSPTSLPMDLEPESSPPGSVRRGHVRSKHTIDSWTWQPGMKKSFSIGYRADCEKCRLKVPGHFNHIVIS